MLVLKILQSLLKKKKGRRKEAVCAFPWGIQGRQRSLGKLGDCSALIPSPLIMIIIIMMHFIEHFSMDKLHYCY